VEPASLVRGADSLSFCLSKGLSAPVGSLVCGSGEFIEKAHRQRKMLGGGMRQAGVLAAAGIVALETMVGRLAHDHANAQRLANGLSRLSGILVDPERVHTNIVIFDLAPEAPAAARFADRMASNGVKVGAIGGRRLRAVTHHGVTATDVDYATTVAAAVLSV
jgi:threonine aldolase